MSSKSVRLYESDPVSKKGGKGNNMSCLMLPVGSPISLNGNGLNHSCNLISRKNATITREEVPQDGKKKYLSLGSFTKQFLCGE